MSQSVVQDWLRVCSFKEQTTLLSAIRGPDTGGGPEIKAWNRLIRRTILQQADPNGRFMQVEPLESFIRLDTEKQHVLHSLPIHFWAHLVHAFEVLAYRHPDGETAAFFYHTYHDCCRYLHQEPESNANMTRRLADNRAT